MSDLAYDFFGKGKSWNAALWAYGFTHYPKVPNLKDMKNNYGDFEKEIAKMQFFDTSNYLTTSKKDTSILPRLDPHYKKWERIVAVGFNVPPGTGQNCLLVADMSNFGRDMNKYEIEQDLLAKVGYDFFEKSNTSTVALWAYGYTDYSKDVEKSLEKLIPNYKQLATELEKMKLFETNSPLTTAKYENHLAIEAINAMVDRQNRVNCLVFFSAQKDTGSLPKLNPSNTNIETIVAVGYDNTKLNNIVPRNGVALSIPLHFLDDHVDYIVSAMLRREIPTTTTKKPTTTKPKPTHKCLFVGDVFSYAKNQEAYDLVFFLISCSEGEADLIADVAHDLYNGFDGSTIGLWAYGYTNFSKYAVTGLQNMRKNYDDFIKDLNGMVYYETDIPLSTAKQDLSYLPYLNPVYLPLEVVVAVGLNDTDFSSRLNQEIGIPVSVPIHYVDKDVKAIVDAITEKEKPSPKPTTPAPTTTTEPPPSKDAIRCLFTGDLYNYGHNDEDYELVRFLPYDL
ncbi:hypothetical protein ANCDUO_13208 [Ancylostoma duodenale]|uniref:Uncharacterized protein n=1 Tax=Ancylostoma duodenale TaxID=51022 RepID=A0A0C2GHR2_9BILA|nr:hypothetical protein ANCDUO_13208 [Ancylostoma duodenale]